MAKIGRRTRHLLLLGVIPVGVVAVLLVQERQQILPDGEKPLSQFEPDANVSAPKANRAESLPESPLWNVIDESSTDDLPGFSARWSTEGRLLVGVSGALAAATGWRVGDRLSLPVPQVNEVYRPLIESIDDGPGPSRAALGKVTGKDGQQRRFVVTVGPAHMFAYIDTAQGSFELVGGGELGWLMPTSSIMAGFDYSEPDYLLPDGWDELDGP